jgi:hypothetical protein
MLTVCIGQVEAQKVGTSSLQFLKVMPTARATAMGDAYVSLASGADAAFWNPAGLTNLKNHEMTSTLTMWLFDTKQVALAYGLPMGDLGTLGFQFQYVDFGSIEETRADAVELVVPANGTPFFNAGLTGRTFALFVPGRPFIRTSVHGQVLGRRLGEVRDGISLVGSGDHNREQCDG